MRISQIMTILKEILDNDVNIRENYPTLTVTHKFLSTPVDEVVEDYPWISLRYIRETSEDVIGSVLDVDVDDNVVEGIFRDGWISAYCWDDTVLGAEDLAVYAKQALFKMRHYYEDDGLLEISNFDVGESTEARAPFEGFRCVIIFKVWIKEAIDIIT